MNNYIYNFDNTEKITPSVLKAGIKEGTFLYAWILVAKFIVKLDLQPFHYLMMEQTVNNKNHILLAPRGFGKSYLNNTCYCITKLLKSYLENDGSCNITIAIVCRIDTQAKDFVTQLKRYFEKDTIIWNVFGDIRGKPWDTHNFNLKRNVNLLESNINACSVMSPSSLVSKHYHMLILDDIFDNSFATKNARDKVQEVIYNSVFPAMNKINNKEAQKLIIGTRYHTNDIYGRLLATNNYTLLKIPALINNKSIWEDGIPTAELIKLKNENPLAFKYQYMEEVNRGGGGIFKEEWINFFNEYRIIGGKVYAIIYNPLLDKTENIELRLFGGADLAISKKDTADYFVNFVVGLDIKTNNLYVLDCIRAKLTFNEQLEAIKKMYAKWGQLERIGIEVNQYQGALLQEIKRTTNIPVVPIRTVIDKITKLTQFSSFFENQQIFLFERMNFVEELIEELLVFPDGAHHDDLPDCLCIAHTISQKYKGNKIININPFKNSF